MSLKGPLDPIEQTGSRSSEVQYAYSVFLRVLLGHQGFCPRVSNMLWDYIKGS